MGKVDLHIHSLYSDGCNTPEEIVMMAKRKMSVTELANRVDITMANLSILKNNKAKAVRFTTLDAICRVLECQPGDILEYVEDDEDE